MSGGGFQINFDDIDKAGDMYEQVARSLDESVLPADATLAVYSEPSMTVAVSRVLEAFRTRQDGLADRARLFGTLLSAAAETYQAVDDLQREAYDRVRTALGQAASVLSEVVR